jgi:hypothetical protein
VIVTVAVMTTAARSVSRTRFSFRLDAEWTRLRTHRRALAQARTWAGVAPDDPLGAVVAELDDLDVIVRATQRSAADGDAILLRLVEIARTGDELAGRVLLQRLLPALIAGSMRYRGFHDDLDPVELVVPAAWEAIRRFDTTRRRRQIAASLVSDAVFAAFRAPLRRMAATEEVRSPQRFIDTIDTAPTHTPIEVLADVVVAARRAGVPAADLDLICRLVQVESPGVVAAERHVTARTIRNHRDRAVRRIRDAIAA